MVRGSSALVLVLALALGATPAVARDLFRATYSFESGALSREGENRLKDISGALTSVRLREANPDYDGTERVSMIFDLRGIVGTATFPTDSADLLIEVPALDLTLFIPSGTGAASIAARREIVGRLFRGWLEGDLELPIIGDADDDDGDGDGGGGSSTTDISPLLAALIELSPVDPVAGNPASLESRMVAADYRAAVSSPFWTREDPDPWRDELVRHVRLEADGDYFSAGPYNGGSLGADFGIEFGTPTPKAGVLLDLPFHFNQTQGAQTYMASLGLGAAIRPLPNWNIVPMLRIGIVGSIDLGGGALLYQGTLASVLRFDLGESWLLIGNQFSGGSNVNDVEIGGIVVDYHLRGYHFRNGFELHRPLPASPFGTGLEGMLYFTATNYLGSDRYLENQFDVGLGLSVPFGLDAARDKRVRLKTGYTGGKGYDSLRMELAVHF